MLALGLLAAFAGPAGAKKSVPEVEVTLEGDLDTEDCGGPILMEERRKGVLSAGEDGPSTPPTPRIWIDAPLEWSRNFPTQTSGEDFSERISPSGESFSWCHGGPVDDSPPYWDGLLRITPTADSVEILWIFDHYWEEGVPKPRGKKAGLIIENFKLSGEAFLVDDPEAFLDQSDVYTGNFTISYFLRDDSNGEHIEFDLGTVTLSFQLSTSP